MTAIDRLRWLPASVLAVLAVVAAAIWLAPAPAPARGGPPAEDSAAVGFSRDMAIHHQQAVEMSLLVRDRSTDQAIRRLAYDILNTQATQRGMMLGWLGIWGHSPTSSRPPMAWMGMPPPTDAARRAGALMPGMATRQDLDALRTAGPGQVDSLFLRLMIEHHRGGVHMAQGLLAADRDGGSQVRQLAQGVVRSQDSEITLMTAMLAERA